jgi:Tol biopolymer transport system component
MTTRIARAGVVFCCLAALLLATVPAGAGAFPGENGKIVYIAGDDIFTVDPDGTDVANLTNTPSLDAENVSASPDGKRIAFNVGTQSVLDDAGLYVINMNGTGARDVLAGRHDDFIAVGAPAWSPDGKRLAFEGYDYPGFHNELFVIDADGTDLRRLTNCDCVSSSYPVWSPIGPEIAFVPCCSQVVTTINANTGATAEVFAPQSGYASNITWSPDGTQIAYDDLIEVYRVSIPGGTPVALTSTGPGYYSNPSWSPDGTRILVESNHASQQSNNRDIYAIDAVSGVDGVVTRITTALDSEGQPEWAPLCEGQCTPTAIVLRITKTASKVKVAGQIQPAVPGSANVALFKKTSTGWKRLRSTASRFDAEGLFNASFNRPAGGRCKVEARYAGDAEREGTLARKLFAC